MVLQRHLHAWEMLLAGAEQHSLHWRQAKCYPGELLPIAWRPFTCRVHAVPLEAMQDIMHQWLTSSHHTRAHAEPRESQALCQIHIQQLVLSKWFCVMEQIHDKCPNIHLVLHDIENPLHPNLHPNALCNQTKAVQFLRAHAHISHHLLELLLCWRQILFFCCCCFCSSPCILSFILCFILSFILGFILSRSLSFIPSRSGMLLLPLVGGRTSDWMTPA